MTTTGHTYNTPFCSSAFPLAGLGQGVLPVHRRAVATDWRRFTYDEILARDKVSLDIFWLRGDSLGDMDNLFEPDEIAEENVENLEAGLEGFRRVLGKPRRVV